MRLLLSFIGLALASPQLPVPKGSAPPVQSFSPSPLPPDQDPTPTQSPNVPTVLPDSPICECGYTYCASVLMAMPKPWNQKQLGEAYCNTPNATCTDEKPESKVGTALFICLCEEANQKIGNTLDLLCGCDTCLNIGPDNRARCATPCVVAGNH